VSAIKRGGNFQFSISNFHSNFKDQYRNPKQKPKANTQIPINISCFKPPASSFRQLTTNNSNKNPMLRSTTTSQQRKNQLTLGLILLVATFVLAGLWRGIFPDGSVLESSSLKTTFNRLSSTAVEFSIPEAGTLRISTGPTSFLDDARVFGLVIATQQAQFADIAKPFLVSSAYESIFNLVDSADPSEAQLALIFPQGQFAAQGGTLAELPFTTALAGQFEIRGIYFGSLPSNTFPAYQDFPIFVESSNILFDENGEAQEVAGPSTGPVVPVNPACSDGFDNDADGKTDHPDDPGCEDPIDTDETDPAGPEPIRLDIPSQYLETIQTPDLRTEYLVVLPPAQEQLRYQFDFKSKGGEGTLLYGVLGRTANANQVYPLENSGLALKESGSLIGEPGALKGGNYRYQFFVTDGDQTLNFSVQIPVHDTLGNPVGLEIDTSIAAGEHLCFVGQVCEAFFRTTQGIAPYRYSFTGESPTGSSFLQANAGEAFYRFIPTADQQGEYAISIAVFDSAKRTIQEGEQIIETNNTATIDFTLKIQTPDIETNFRFAAERQCEFLDLSAVDPTFDFFQFTCRNGIIEGSAGVIREFDTFNRAEAAKVTSLILSDESTVIETFGPFANLPASTSVNYNDVTVGDWYGDDVYYLFQNGVIVDNNVYRPGDTLNAAEAMKLVIESYAALSGELLGDLEDITVYDEWYEPYQTVASYLDATIAVVDPARPAERGLIAELLFKLHRAYPVDKFK
jgi:hypothetical protein